MTQCKQCGVNLPEEAKYCLQCGTPVQPEEPVQPTGPVAPPPELDFVQPALTGGMFSRSPANLKRARQELQAGNVYLNRGITGALVERQPFGGFKLSGIGTKAGGPDYLLQFVLPRTITENTMRRGFAPAPGE